VKNRSLLFKEQLELCTKRALAQPNAWRGGKTGKKFNPRKHELDHEIAFSKGGSHTAENPRVLEKKRNRSNGAESPFHGAQRQISTSGLRSRILQR
jgi:hypothetical protein